MNLRCAAGLLVVFCPGLANAGGPKAEPLKAWNEYVQRVDPESGPFLWLDKKPGLAARVHGGEVLAEPAAPPAGAGFPGFGSNDPEVVPFGLIHDWVGAVFIPSVTLAQVFAVIDDYDRYSYYYGPTVATSALLCRDGDEERYRVRYTRKVLFVTAILDSEYEVRHVRLDERRWYTITQSTRLGERQDEESGSRYLWRLYSVSKFEQRDGGVYLEQRNIALSRAIPSSLQWLVAPAIRQLSRELTLTSLRQTRDAVNMTARAICLRSVAPSEERGHYAFE